MTTYSIVRFHQDGPSVVMRKGLTLDEAKVHCANPETSSRTAASKRALAYTAEHGPWFDGYRVED